MTLERMFYIKLIRYIDMYLLYVCACMHCLEAVYQAAKQRVF
jgi:hypothetical protein